VSTESDFSQFIPAGTVEVRVSIGDLAGSLTAVRQWLSRNGCTYQVLRCVRDGREAVIRVEFDCETVSLRDAFSRNFS
jgi:hypothetical protein